MNILIVSTNRNAYPVPVLPSGACMIAEAAERAGHRVSLLDLMFTADPLRALKEMLTRTKFDIIGLSVRNIDNIDMGAPRYFINDLTAQSSSSLSTRKSRFNPNDWIGRCCKRRSVQVGRSCPGQCPTSVEFVKLGNLLE